MPSCMCAPTSKLVSAAIALRVALMVLGIGHYLAYRVEVSTPANSLLSIREGVALLRLRISPYAGSACHVPPLLLWLLAPTAMHTQLYALPNILCDVVGGLLLRAVAKQLLRVRQEDAKRANSEAGALSVHCPLDQ